MDKTNIPTATGRLDAESNEINFYQQIKIPHCKCLHSSKYHVFFYIRKTVVEVSYAVQRFSPGEICDSALYWSSFGL